jgi:hypothetical protein
VALSQAMCRGVVRSRVPANDLSAFASKQFQRSIDHGFHGFVA